MVIVNSECVVRNGILTLRLTATSTPHQFLSNRSFVCSSLSLSSLSLHYSLLSIILQIEEVQIGFLQSRSSVYYKNLHGPEKRHMHVCQYKFNRVEHIRNVSFEELLLLLTVLVEVSFLRLSTHGRFFFFFFCCCLCCLAKSFSLYCLLQQQLVVSQ